MAKINQMPEMANNATEILTWVIGIIAAVTAFISKIWPQIRKLFNVIRELKHVIEHLPSFIETSNNIAKVTHELTPNNGSSVKDALTRIEATLERQNAENAALWKTSFRRAFKSTPAGYFQDVNNSLRVLLKREATELTGYGWLNCIKLGQRESLLEEFRTAGNQSRNFEYDAVLKLNGDEIEVHIQAEPIKLADGTVLHYLGSINTKEV